MAACLDSLRALRYPATEVVVVDDGSTDRTGAIADQYEGFHVIHQENKGLSAARNVGMAASTGEIVAYTDSDCVVDPDWLHYLVATFLSSGLPAVGGPNLPPPEDSFVASCVAASPGGPLEVLLDDEEAEHIPGCNMAFRREALEEIGGLRPGVPRRRGRRGRLLAPAESRLPHRLEPRGDGVALPAQYGQGVHRAAARLRQGGGAPVLPPPAPLQRARLCALARADLRRRLVDPVAGAPGGLRRCLWPRAVSDALPAAVEPARAPAVHARVERGRPGALGLCHRARRARLARGLAARADVGGVPGRGAPRAGRRARRRRSRPRAHRAPDLPRASLALPRAVPVVGAWPVPGGAGRR